MPPKVLLILTRAFCTFALAAQTAVALGDLLQFADGSSLHGRLRMIDIDKGIEWEHPAARTPIVFSPDNLALIKLEKCKPVAAQEIRSCRFRLKNGDEIFGNLSSLEGDSLQLATWFGDHLKAPRQAIDTITFLSKGFAILYDGPWDTEGWKLGRGWTFRDGTFIANGSGVLGRNFQLSGSSSLEFDLNWNGQFSLVISMYTQVLDRFDYSASAYMFYFGPGYASLQRVQAGLGISNIGQAQIPMIAQNRKAHIELRVNKDDSSLALLVDGQLIQKWKDNAGFAGAGSGIAFFSQMEGLTLRLGNIKVAEWDGRLEPEGLTHTEPSQDMVHLINRDKVSGSLQSIRDGKLAFTTADSQLQIPLQRITQIFFADSQTQTNSTGPWDIRAYFAGGGTVAFQLKNWNDATVTGESPNFGQINITPQSIRQIQFNLSRPKNAPDNTASPDDELWDPDE